VNTVPGILNGEMTFRKKISIDSNNTPNFWVFFFDEMDLKKQDEYFQKKYCVFGPSKKVHVMMVRGLLGSQP
jgi:hypothetical protein